MCAPDCPSRHRPYRVQSEGSVGGGLDGTPTRRDEIRLEAFTRVVEHQADEDNWDKM